ncbi:MAG: alpha-1,4-glucan--maltose-1-phosphate maltosyltransferase [Proteobacteria bacterium]|nr:alpha-1,4-glucan--maltose-1-phosphate maltosyltransferase [Pseudomonadota bacterium]
MDITQVDKKFGHQRIIIENVDPEIDCGKFPIKRCINESVVVKAKIFADGHDELAAVLKFRSEKNQQWQTIPMNFLGNDLYQADFKVTEIGFYYYTIDAWVDYFTSWRSGLIRWHQAKQDIEMVLKIGAELIEKAISKAQGSDLQRLHFYHHQLNIAKDIEHAFNLATSEELTLLMEQYPDLENFMEYSKQLTVFVDRARAGFSSWYELFPRSLGQAGRHGTLLDLKKHLPYIAGMGFDVVYLPPIHPIGFTYRKGKNNNPQASQYDPGSPWGIGAIDGGHTSIHPQLGTLEQFRELVQAAKEQGLEIALDLAIQCTPDHPYVQEHSQWFKKRPDGSIQYAENPPKKYQDIYPIYFQTDDWQALWQEWKNNVLFWIHQGVKIFRVDNPHTKSFIFWQWLISEIKREYPEIIFLSEAFTRPSVMYYLAKIGFSQSYTYFTWRTSKYELTEYVTELTKSAVREYFRPNFWPNTPDILHEFLQVGGRPAFVSRLILAATITANYGIYGPVYELCVNQNREPGSEEYLDSEKYQMRQWNLQQENSLYELIRKVNQVRRANPCLQSNGNFQFHHTDNEQLIAYSKATDDQSNIILVVVNLDPHYTQSGWVDLSLSALGLGEHQSFCVVDLLEDVQYLWQGRRNYIELNPHKMPAHIFNIRRVTHTEQNFQEYQ